MRQNEQSDFQNLCSDLFHQSRNKGNSENILMLPVSMHLARLVGSSQFDKEVFIKWVEDEKKLDKTLSTILGRPELKEAYKILIDKYLRMAKEEFLTVLDKMLSIELESMELSDYVNNFDELLKKITLSLGRSMGEYSTPQELVHVATNLYATESGMAVYNPFSGIASFGTQISDEINYFGQEIKKETWALGLINLAVHERLDNSTYLNQDSITEWNSDTKFDLIISFPPLSMRISKNKKINGRSRFVSDFLIRKTINQLTENGKALFILPNNFLFSHRLKSLRKKLVEKDAIEYIIQFPGNIFSHTSIPFNIVALNKSKRNKGQIGFVKADEFVEYKGTRHQAFIQAEKALKQIENYNAKYAKYVSKSEILKQDYDLSTGRYFLELDELLSKDTNTVKLEEILKPLNLKAENIRNKHVVHNNDLKETHLNYKITPSDIKKKSTNRNSRKSRAYKLKESALLVASHSNTPRPSYFEKKGNSNLLLSPRIFAFRVDTEKIYIPYLINELHSEHVKKQYDAYKKGTAIHSISKNDFLDIKIRWLDIKEQEAKVQGIRESYVEKKREEVRLLEEKYQVQKEAYSDFASLTHSLGRPLSNFGSELRIIENIVEQNLKNNAVYGGLRESIQILQENHRFMNDVIDRNGKDIDPSSYELNPIFLKEYIEEYIKRVRTRNNYSFRTSLSYIYSYSEENDFGIDPIDDWYYDDGLLSEKVKIKILANNDLLKILFDNIFENAEDHGFEGKYKNDNKLVVEIGLIDLSGDSKVLITLKNNGRPFQKNFTKEKFVRKFETTKPKRHNAGIGGNHIEKIINYFGGSFELLLDAKSEYPVGYEIEIPILEIEGVENGKI